MRAIRVGGVIQRPVADVFRVLSDPENAPRWSQIALEEKLTSPRPIRVGSTRRALVKTLAGRREVNEAVCTAFELDRTLAWRSTSAPIPFAVSVDFGAIDRGTRVDSTWTWEPKGLLRFISPLLDRMIRRAIRNDIEHLRELMEAGGL